MLPLLTLQVGLRIEMMSPSLIHNVSSEAESALYGQTLSRVTVGRTWLYSGGNIRDSNRDHTLL